MGSCAHRTRERSDSSHHDPELITAMEIAGVNGSTVYDASVRTKLENLKAELAGI